MYDELNDTMKQDVTVQEFIYQRVREMFEEIILSQREVLIEKLSSQYAFLKMEFGKIEQDKRKLTVDLLVLQDEQAYKEVTISISLIRLRANLIDNNLLEILPFLI